jgi:riboflavin synthase
MFTGIIQALGTVKSLALKGADALLEIETGITAAETKIGDSIAVNGACLTVTKLGGRGFAADVSAETLSRTTLGGLKQGDRVNLEKSLRVSDLLGGHLVLGHVDGVGRIVERTAKSNSIIFGIEVESGLARYIVEKGSVAVDGISLTVNKCGAGRFYLNIIPLTAVETTLGFRKNGDRVNIETDIIGKYVERFLKPEKGLDLNFLAEHGFK